MSVPGTVIGERPGPSQDLALLLIVPRENAISEFSVQDGP